MPGAGGLLDISANADVPVEIAVEPAAVVATSTRTATPRLATATPHPTSVGTSTATRTVAPMRTATATRTTAAVRSATPAPTSTARGTAAPTPPPWTASPPSSPGGRLVNLSTRAYVGTGDHVVIGGFAVSGARTQVLIRAIGPSLAGAGVSGVLDDPTVSVYRGQSQLAFNDDWRRDDAARIRAAGFAPSHPQEAAIVLDLEPGLYTAIVRGYANHTGIGLVEVFRTGGAGRLVNLSTRARVGFGDDVAIGGFVVSDRRTRVLLRAIGPELGRSGVPDPLGDPVLTLFTGSTKLAFNDDWTTWDEARIRATGLAPAHPRESAILVDLDPGLYTAIVSGYDGAGGVALFEAFVLASP